jgi:hypothetical protein
METINSNLTLTSNPYLGNIPTPGLGLSGTISNGTSYISNLPSICLTSKKAHMQVKIGIFKVKRDEDNNIISSSIDLLAAKELEDNFNPKEVVVKEIYTVNLNY